VERVFAFITDFAARARLNPLVVPIRVEIESGVPLQLGSICHFRLQSGNRVLDYRSRVTEYIPNRKIVTHSDTAVPFEICLETEPEHGGCRYTHTEQFEPSEAMLQEVPLPDSGKRFMAWLDTILLFLEPNAAERLRDQRETALRARLQENLLNWQAAIRRHLEQVPH